MVDAATKTAVGKIPILKTNAGPRDKEAWVARLKEEYNSLITYIKSNKESDTDWFRLEANKEGNRKCIFFSPKIFVKSTYFFNTIALASKGVVPPYKMVAKK